MLGIQAELIWVTAVDSYWVINGDPSTRFVISTMFQSPYRFSFDEPWMIDGDYRSDANDELTANILQLVWFGQPRLVATRILSQAPRRSRDV